MYSKEKALDLLKKHNTPERTINHSIWVWEIALEIATKINNNHRELQINVEKVMMWWYLETSAKLLKNKLEKWRKKSKIW